MWNSAITDIVEKTKRNIVRFNGLYPHASSNDQYELNDNDNWTNGFWSGLLWLCAEYSGDEFIRNAADESVQSLSRRLEQDRALDHHDLGFLYILSAKAQWLIEKDVAAKQVALKAADALMRRWRPGSRLIQAWGPEGDSDNGGRIIIDCLMNLPLLYWAAQETGVQSCYDAAAAHTEKSRRYLVRGDDSSYHTFYFDKDTGEPIRGATQQGYKDGSTWTRGQAWGIYGFALSYRYTGDEAYLETSRRMAHYFIKHLPPDHVAYWDFDVPIDAETKRDSSASAIAASGMLELIAHLNEDDPDRELFMNAVHTSMQSLLEQYSTIGDDRAQGILKHGSYSVREGKAPDDYVIWGDYFYMEALMKLHQQHKGYW